MRIAFYAPLKAPDHPAPSGDRTLARLLLAALQRAGAARGWEVEVASRFRSFDGGGDAERQTRLRDLGARIADRLVRRYLEGPADRRPGLWFTYHLYHKAPDWLGPTVSQRLGIPYLVAEASHAAKQAGGAWSIGYEAASHAIRNADAILALNRDDVRGVQEVTGDPSRITVLPPFLDPGGVSGEEGRSGLEPLALAISPEPSPAFGSSGSREEPAPPGGSDARAAVARRWGVPPREPRLLCVAMMRGGRKLASFDLLADALTRSDLAAARWHLVVAGEGPARRAVEAAFARRLPAGRVTFTGRVEGGELARLYAGSDLFVWPAVGEPMGMAMLEAQGHGLPVVAARTRGVPDLVRDSETGMLVPEGDAAAFADAVQTLLQTPDRRRRMGLAARARVAREHSVKAASERIGDLVEALVRARPPDTRSAPDARSAPDTRLAPRLEPAPVKEAARAAAETKAAPP